MVKKSKHLRVDPEFHKIVNDSGLPSRVYTKMLAEKLWEEKLKKKNKGFGGFVI